MNNYNWACIGCGHIAGEMAESMKSLGKRFYALYSKTPERANNFAHKYDIENVYGSIDELLADDNIDIVYIATPHNSHLELMLMALGAGKHVLCEKAITLNSDELEQASALASKKGVVLAEAMTIYHCPVYKMLDKVIDSGRLGALKLVQVNLGSNKDYDMTNRFFSMELAGGAMLDIGVYALSFMRCFMSECPKDIISQVKKAPTGADEQVGILLKNSKDEMATVTLSLTAKLPKLAIASFENGYIMLDNYNRARKATITYNDDGHTDTLADDGNIDALGCEVIDMENAVEGKCDMHLDYTIDVMNIMTKVRHTHNMYYNEEK